MTKLQNSGNTLAAWGIAALAAGVLVATVRAAAQHQLGNLDSVVTVQIAIVALALVPAVFSELRDRQTLSVYRAMRSGN